MDDFNGDQKIKKEKKPYQPPAWQKEQAFEKTVLTCAQNDDSGILSGPLGY